MDTDLIPHPPPERPRPPEGFEMELAGLDALEFGETSVASRAQRLWAATWPKLAALVIALAIWQGVVWSHWKPTYVLPPPGPVFRQLWHDAGTVLFWKAIGTTMRRAVVGFTVAAVLGLLLGGAVARSRILRSAVGSLITGLQTMPSVVWFPLAILLFKLSESAITFVVVIGAAPSIANGFVGGIDHVPPLLLRSGRMLGAKSVSLWRHVIVPAALPSIVAGLKQGWAFAWRSLMAGELLVIIAHRPSVGERLNDAENLNDVVGLLVYMLVILILGILVDALFGAADRTLRARWGLIGRE
jgi:NitT/TauT family transport system permease protein